jgi:hypothetical protein
MREDWVVEFSKLKHSSIGRKLLCWTLSSMATFSAASGPSRHFIMKVSRDASEKWECGFVVRNASEKCLRNSSEKYRLVRNGREIAEKWQ